MAPDTCVHYTGAINPQAKGVCAVGVNYRELVGGDNTGWCSRLPCIVMEARGGEKVTCAQYRPPTPEEIAEDKRQGDEAIRKHMIAFTGKVREWREANKWDRKNPRAATGAVPCEACNKGEIRLSMSAYNGHVWGACSTEGCVQWME